MKRITCMLLMFTLLTTSGCAVFNRQNTPALNMVEKNLIPKENPGRALSYPLVIPLGAVAATLDMFVFHPASVVSDCWDDTTDLVWDKMRWDTQYATTSASLIPRTVLTPLVFTGDFLFRSSFDIHKNRHPVISREDYARRQELKKQAEQTISLQAAEALKNGRYTEAVTLADKALASNSYLYDAASIKAAALLESGQTEKLAAMSPYQRIFSSRDFTDRFAAKLEKASPADTLHLLSILEKHSIVRPATPKNETITAEQQLMLESQQRLVVLFIGLFGHDDRAVRLRAIQAAGKRSNDQPELRPALEKIAAGDDPVLAVAAKEALPVRRK